MPVKIFCVLAIIPLSSALWPLIWPQRSTAAPDFAWPGRLPFEVVTMPQQLQVPYIPKADPCQAYHTMSMKDGQISSHIRVPWDGSSNFELKVKLVFGRLLPIGDTKVHIKMVQPSVNIISGLLYELHYPDQKILPQLTEISLNGREICHGEPEKPLPYGPYNDGSTTLTLTHRTHYLGQSIG